MNTSNTAAQPSGDRQPRHDHGDVVREAIHGRVKVLIAGVLAANLGLGLWLINRADFSELRPNGSPVAAKTHAPVETEVEVEIPTPRPEDGRAQLVFAEHTSIGK